MRKTYINRERIQKGCDMFNRGLKAVPALYSCPSEDGGKTYQVDISDSDEDKHTCTCPDHVYRGVTCKHIILSWLSAESLAA